MALIKMLSKGVAIGHRTTSGTTSYEQNTSYKPDIRGQVDRRQGDVLAVRERVRPADPPHFYRRHE